MEDANAISSDQEIEDLIRARYPIIYVASAEEERVAKSMIEIARRRNRNLVEWTSTEGFRDLYRVVQDDDASNSKGSLPPDTIDPLKALDQMLKHEDHAIFLMKDYHPFLDSRNYTVVRKLRDMVTAFKTGRHYRHIVFLSPVLKMPPELEQWMAIVDYALPNRDDIDGVVDRILRSLPPELPLRVREDPQYRGRVVESALGLILAEAENVFSKSLVRKKCFDVNTILAEKKHIIRKSGILEFYQAYEKFSNVGGLEVLKNWLNKREKAFSADARAFGLPTPKGILLVGVPGCGKSLCAKAISSMWQLPLLRLDVGKIFQSLVGSSEENIRKAIKTAEAVAPSILWLDELEKGFAGVGGGGTSDGGTSSRVFGSFITWLQEKSSPVFVIATANDVSALPPELLRKGRFDEIFFVDLPSEEERAKIFEIHLRRKNRDPSKFNMEPIVKATQGFSGSEIEQAIISALFDAYELGEGHDIDTDALLRSVREIIPLSYTAKEKIDYLREWAKSRARTASAATASTEADQVRTLEL